MDQSVYRGHAFPPICACLKLPARTNMPCLDLCGFQRCLTADQISIRRADLCSFTYPHLKLGVRHAVVRCCAGMEERPRGPLALEPRGYGQVRGVIPFSCAYLAADASTRGRTST